MALALNKNVVVRQTTTFLGTGAVQTFTVPANVFALRFFMWGAGGGNQSGSGTIVNGSGGGSGAYLEGTISTTPGTTYQIIVGQIGLTTLASGGGGSTSFGGGGGGFTGIFSGSPAANTVIAIAGGGGGCCANGRGNGGGGGYPNASSGTGLTAGGGGTQTTGGTAGGNGFAGTQLQGGNAGNVNDGGGGGGWWGGGGAGSYNGGGGGGSSTYISSVINPVSINGSVGITTTGSNTPAPNESSPYWISPAGRSAASGLLILGYTPVAPLMRFSNILPVTTTATFFGTGSVQTFTVPGNVSYLQFFLWGSGGIGQNGATNTGAAGGGAFVSGTIRTSPGTTYSIVVGRPGVGGIANGGSTSGGTSAGGGGFSGIFSGSPAANTVIAIAGAGGGSGFNGGGVGGGGGYPNGLPGVGTQSQGGGGTQTAGGAGGPGGGAAGSQLQGGNGGSGDNGGGGGGGGWYGGGGGILQGAGGGGSSTYIASVLNPVTANGNTGGGATPTPPGGRSSPYWISPLGSAGQNGLVVLAYSFSPLPQLSYTPYAQQFRTTASFYGTGTVQSFTVPNGVTLIRMFCWGSGGVGQNGANFGVAGTGAYAAASLIVTPGQVLYIVVGRPGAGGIANGGSTAGGTSANGGGFSGVFSGSSPSEYNTLLIAGAGGGSGFNGGGVGGGGGYPNGSPGTGSQAQGGGGTQSSAGRSFGTAAGQLFGGNGVIGDNGGGGGGGGWYGGGGGTSQGAGGGGSSYASPRTRSPEFVNGFNGGITAPNESSPYWQSPFGRGGQNGLVVIAY